MIIADSIRVLVPAAIAFIVGLVMTPSLTHYLYAHKAWKKKSGKTALDGSVAETFSQLHKEKEVCAPRMGGIVIWASVLFTTLGLWICAQLFPATALASINFLTRNQTWIPLAVLVVGALAGLIDDLMTIRPSGDGLKLSVRLLMVVFLSACIGWWFWSKLGVTAISIPYAAPLYVGIGIIPFFVVLSLALYASGVIDGIDGLSGGVFASIFFSYAVIAFMQNEVYLAAFCAAVVGGILAFLWFNIPPARFYMSETGTMGLTLSLGVVALMTDSLGGGVGIAVLPIIGGLLVVTVLSNIVQVVYKKIYHRKLLRVAPLHHHFEAIGWPGYKVAMRYWVISIILGFVGVTIAASAL
jgi:phospho-N-acetylmuramoyl-pentapeptide-transferase